MRLRLSLVLALAGAIAAGISCGGIVDPSQNKTDTFAGTVQPGGSSAKPFSASQTGELTIAVGLLTPASQPLIGVQWVQGAGDGTCNGAILQQNQFAPANTTAIAGQIPAGNYCVIMYDSVGLTQPETYVVTVSHP